MQLEKPADPVAPVRKSSIPFIRNRLFSQFLPHDILDIEQLEDGLVIVEQVGMLLQIIFHTATLALSEAPSNLRTEIAKLSFSLIENAICRHISP